MLTFSDEHGRGNINVPVSDTNTMLLLREKEFQLEGEHSGTASPRVRHSQADKRTGSGNHSRSVMQQRPDAKEKYEDISFCQFFYILTCYIFVVFAQFALNLFQ